MLIHSLRLFGTRGDTSVWGWQQPSCPACLGTLGGSAAATCESPGTALCAGGTCPLSGHSLTASSPHPLLSRMKSLEQDALKAQMVIAKSKEGRKRSTLEQLAESPSPAPTPSPTPLEGTGQLLLLQGARQGSSRAPAASPAHSHSCGRQFPPAACLEGRGGSPVIAPELEVRLQGTRAGTQPASWFCAKAPRRGLLGGQEVSSH